MYTGALWQGLDLHREVAVVLMHKLEEHVFGEWEGTVVGRQVRPAGAHGIQHSTAQHST